MIITTTTTTTTVTLTTNAGMFGEGIFLVALLIILLSIKEIAGAEKNGLFSSFASTVTYIIVPFVSVFFIIVAQKVIGIW